MNRTESGTAQRELQERASLLLARALVDRTRALYRELEQRTGAPVQVHRALACIAAAPGIPASHLASELGMQRSAVSHLLKALVTRGWIERRRADDDQRSVHLYVTAAGRGIVGATSGRVVGILQRAVQKLGDDELAQLEHSLGALLQHVDKPAPQLVRPKRVRARGRC